MTEPTMQAAIYINPADAFDPDVSWSLLPFGEHQCKMVPADALDAAQAENARLRARVAELEGALKSAAEDLDDYSPLTGNTVQTSASRAARAALAEGRG